MAISIIYFIVNQNDSPNVESHLSFLNYLSTFFSLYLSIYMFYFFFLNYWKLVKIGCKIKSMVVMNFKKLIVKIVNLIFEYILSS